MPSFEEELKRFEPVIKALTRISLLGKKVVVWGQENFIRQGPNIIIGNHIGSFKDVAIMFKVVPRPIFFTANKMIFTRREFDELVLGHLRTHLKNFGVFLNLLLTPLKAFFVNYISSNIVKIGTIPVDLYNKKRETIGVVEDYLRKGRSIIALQGRGRVMPKDPHPYVKRFSGGTSVIVYNLLQEEISVPITPIAMFGTQIPIFVPGKIHVNVGQPLYIKDYFTGEFQETVEKFKIALESSVKNLFREFLNH